MKAGLIALGLTMGLALLPAAADDGTLHNVTHPKQSPAVLNVTFESPAPGRASVSPAGAWYVQCYTVAGQRPSVLAVKSAAPSAEFDRTRLVRLELEQAVPDACSNVVVTWLDGGFASASWARPEGSDASGASNADAGGGSSHRLFIPVSESGGDPDISISGTVVSGIGMSPLYSLDASGKYSFLRRSAWELGLSGSALSYSSSTADPDSFRWALNALHTPGTRNGFSQNWDLVGMELDKEADTMNVVTAPSLVWTRSWPHFSQGKVRYTVALHLGAGLELGSNLKNGFNAANPGGGDGSGFFLRGVPSGQFFLIIPTSSPNRAIHFTSTYSLRLPARDEVFFRAHDHLDAVPALGTNPRHYIKNELTFMVTDYFGFTLQHRYGSLPPAFNFTDHKFSVGVEFQASQNK
jgi:hypothetical protein